MIRFAFFGIAVLALMGAAALWNEGQRQARSPAAHDTAAVEVPVPASTPAPPVIESAASSKPAPEPAGGKAPAKPKPRPVASEPSPPEPPSAVARSRTPDREEQVVAPEPFLPEAPAEDGGSDEADGGDGETVVAREPADPDESAAMIRRLLAVYDAVRE